ncbi:MAG TPA: 4-(cytidine 5'-diphospho)-2-C-methyl-D-erythritol kinase [Candidatus Binataceae bacterium]|nr:4-(cytidine 5'-diphospho)-2-C-methyl-D-erythritol kinase [Candidatus Binataceae bacterium]
MVKLLAARALAKINLYLRVTGRRPDGYHELDSVFLPVSLSDSIRLEVRPAPEPSIALKCNVPELGNPQLNLAGRAAREFMREFDFNAQVAIDLEKRIPAGAGLGGGSSDAGMMLQMMARIAHIEEPARLHRIAVGLGADVPFFLEPRPARAVGIGDRLTPIEGMPHLPLVIAIPPFEVPTASIYGALKPENWSGAAPAEDIAAIARGEITSKITVNDLAIPAIAKFPEIGRLRRLLEESGAKAAQMSGSGGAVFGVFASHEEADAAADKLYRRAPFATIITASTLDAASASI